jgi:hypothetical protein
MRNIVRIGVWVLVVQDNKFLYWKRISNHGENT